jgi:hypothetical protein
MESEEKHWLGPDYLDQFKEKYNATALAKAEKVIFDNIAMEQLAAREVESLLNGDLTVKYENIAKFPSKGTATGNLYEIWALVEHFRNREQFRIYTSKDIADYYVLCWGKFGNEDVYVFDEYFKIKTEYKGWKAGVQYGI